MVCGVGGAWGRQLTEGLLRHLDFRLLINRGFQGMSKLMQILNASLWLLHGGGIGGAQAEEGNRLEVQNRLEVWKRLGQQCQGSGESTAVP